MRAYVFYSISHKVYTGTPVVSSFSGVKQKKLKFYNNQNQICQRLLTWHIYVIFILSLMNFKWTSNSYTSMSKNHGPFQNPITSDEMRAHKTMVLLSWSLISQLALTVVWSIWVMPVWLCLGHSEYSHTLYFPWSVLNPVIFWCNLSC